MWRHVSSDNLSFEADPSCPLIYITNIKAFLKNKLKEEKNIMQYKQ